MEDADTATIRLSDPLGDSSAWTRYVDSTEIAMLGAHLTGKDFDTTYFIVYDTVANTYYAYKDYNATLADRFVFVGSLKTVKSDGTGGASGGGSCSTNGLWVFSQDGHATFCASGTWTTKI